MLIRTSSIQPRMPRAITNRIRAPLPAPPRCNSLTDINPDNPWDMETKGEQWEICLENDTLNGILGDPNYNPYETRHRMMQAILLISYGFMYESFKKDLEEENKKALKETQKLILAAK